MAVIRFEVTKITKPFDGESCEFEAKVVSVHTYLFPAVNLFSAKKEMKIGQEFQDFNTQIYKKL